MCAHILYIYAYTRILYYIYIYTCAQCTRRAANTPRSRHLWRCATPASRRTSQKLVITLPAPLARVFFSFTVGKTYIFSFLIFLLLLLLLLPVVYIISLSLSLSLSLTDVCFFSARLDDAKPSARRDNNDDIIIIFLLLLLLLLLFSSPSSPAMRLLQQCIIIILYMYTDQHRLIHNIIIYTDVCVPRAQHPAGWLATDVITVCLVCIILYIFSSSRFVYLRRRYRVYIIRHAELNINYTVL